MRTTRTAFVVIVLAMVAAVVVVLGRPRSPSDPMDSSASQETERGPVLATAPREVDEAEQTTPPGHTPSEPNADGLPVPHVARRRAVRAPGVRAVAIEGVARTSSSFRTLCDAARCTCGRCASWMLRPASTSPEV